MTAPQQEIATPAVKPRVSCNISLVQRARFLDELELEF